MNKDSLITLIFLNLLIILILLLLACNKKEESIQKSEYDNTAPFTTIISNPSLITNSQDALFEFRCSKKDCIFKCKIDSEEWFDCNGSATFSDLQEGPHTFFVYAIDGNGNFEKQFTEYSWVIDITPPTVSFVNKPSATTINTNAEFEFVCNETDCKYECSLDFSNWTECSSPVVYSGLMKGNHNFYVRAKDRAGNIQIHPTEFSWDVIATVISVYPYDTQKDVTLKTPIFLTFSEPVDETTLLNGFILNVDSSSVAGTLQISTDKKKVKFIPNLPLSPNKSHQIILSGVTTEDGFPLTLPVNGIVSNFTTIGERVKSGDGLNVISVEPSTDKFYDFSTLRILFSEPLDPSSVIKNSSFVFKRVSDDTQVSGTLIVNKSRIIFDPETDLIPEEEYRLELTGAIKAINGEQLTPYTLSIYPVGTIPFMELVNEASPDIDDVGGDPNLLPFSDLTGERVNSSVIESKLLGRSTTYLKGLLKAEVRMPLKGSDLLPVVIRKGQILNATGMDIKLGGEIDTLLDTGEISLYLITDSTGYIVSNPYFNLNHDAGPAVYLKLDNCITATDSRVNSVLNQDLIDIGLYGEVTVEGDKMMINALGTTELNVLGAESAPVTLTLRLVGVSSSPPTDSTSPTISSIYPSGDNVPVDTSIIVTFSEPVKESTLGSRIVLTRAGNPVSGRLKTDGSSVIFEPDSPLVFGAQYTITISPGIEDLNGNLLSSGMNQTFTTQPFNINNLKAPLISTIYPGVPCILKNATQGNAGVCSQQDVGQAFQMFELPLNREIVVIFTKPVNPSTVNEDSFQVIDKTTLQNVSGSRIVSYNKVTFIPDEPWITGRNYELKIIGGSDQTCNAEEICGTDGRPLNTDILDDAENLSAEVEGGADMVIPFVGGTYSDDIILPLSLIRYTDTNSNGIADATETQYNENSVYMMATALGIPIPLRTFLSGTLITVMSGYDYISETLPISVPPGSWIFGTSVTALVITSDRLMVRPSGTSSGLIRKPAPSDPDQRPIVELIMNVWMDGVNTAYGADCDGMNMQNTTVTMNLQGRIDFLSDGRMVTALANTNTVNATAIARATIGICLTLNTNIQISPGDAEQRTLTLPVKR